VSDDERLCRRILRDMEQRGTDVVKTIEMWRKHVIHSHHMYVEPHKFECDLDIPWNREKLLAVNAIVGGIEYEYFKSKNNSTK
jgi:uridine kinase